MRSSFLDGLTRPGLIPKPILNPGMHSPLGLRNRIHVEVVGPDGQVKQSVDHVDNLMVTHGLSVLANFIAVQTSAASAWIQAYRIGTDTTAVGFSDNALGNSTASLALSQGAGFMTRSELGARTARYLMTFASDNPAGAYVLNEVGLYCSSNDSTGIAARSVLGTNSVNKGASDEIRISHDIIFTSC
jgi:hypothetical protein